MAQLACAPVPVYAPGAGSSFELGVLETSPRAATVPATSAGQLVSPLPAAEVPARPSTTPSPVAGSGGGGSRPAPVPPALGQVLDENGQALAGALVRLPGGGTVTSDAEGHFPAGSGAGEVQVELQGYAVSVVQGLDAIDGLHLRTRTGQGQPVLAQRHGLNGSLDPAAGPLTGGYVVYVDTAGNSSLSSAIDPAGRFGVVANIEHSGVPRAVVLADGRDAQGQRRVGWTAPFATLETADLPAIPMVPTDHAVTYAAASVPPALDRVTARLEVQQPAGPVTIIDLGQGANGTFQVPASGQLPGALHVVVDARDGAGTAWAVLGAAVGDGGAPVAGDMLELPQPQVQGQVVSWAPVAGALGYRLALQVDNDAGPAWEAWTTSTSLSPPGSAWPAAGSGALTLEAVAAPGFGARQVASISEARPRALRVAPWTSEPIYRVSGVRQAI